MITSSVTSAAPNQLKSKSRELQTEDFIKMMITQLQNQDPLEPAKNQELMAQMSQIGQLQTTTQLQQTLQGLALQNQIGSAGTLIGKAVQGLNGDNEQVEGLVSSVRVEKDSVFLELDNGSTLELSRVTAIAPGRTGGGAQLAA